MFQCTARVALLSLTLVLCQSGCESAHTLDDPVKPVNSTTDDEAEINEKTTKQPLENTRWQLIEVAGMPTIDAKGDRVAHLIFHSEDQRIAGSTGVNRLTGGYTLAGDMLIFGPLAMSRMAGSEPMMKQERLIAQALDGTRSFVIEGNHLILFDETQEPVARFEAVGEIGDISRLEDRR